MPEHTPKPVYKVQRGQWSAVCLCGWSADFTTERKAAEGHKDHVVRARYDEHVNTYGTVAR